MQGAALVATVIFALHPLRVESVAWVTERRDVLSACFLLLAVRRYLSLGRLTLGVLALCLLSLTAKAWAATLPLVLLLLDVWPSGRFAASAHLPAERRRQWLEKLVLAGPCLAAIVLAGLAQDDFGATRSWDQHGLLQRLAQAAYGLVFYPAVTLAPIGLTPLHPLGPSLNPTEARFVLAGGVLVAGAVAVFLARHRYPGLAVAALAYAVLVAPVLGLWQSGPQLVAERYAYLSGLPLALLLGGAALRWATTTARPTRTLTVLAAALALTLSGLTARQCLFWKDSVSLWSRAVDVNPESFFCRYNLGHALFEQSRDLDALPHLQAALAAVAPSRADRVAALQVTAAALGNLGRLDEALLLWEQALQLDSKNVLVLTDLGTACSLLGQRERARACWQRALDAASKAPAQGPEALALARARQGLAASRR